MKNIFYFILVLLSLVLMPGFADAGLDEGVAAYKKGDYATALKEFKPLADQGDVKAQFVLGLMYGTGQGVPQDYKEAVKWYRLAADKGYAIAQSNLGLMYDKGQGVPQNYKEAVKWYRLAADQGNAIAQSNLGEMYTNGKGVPQDYKEAVKWYRLAADQGEAIDQLNLGLMYNIGQGVPQDYKEAARWYRLAADQGVAFAQYNLGILHDNGQGVPQDYKEAVKWYRLAADQGFAKAQYNLGLKYEKGEGVPQGYKEAMKWYRLAVGQGHAIAQCHIGLLYDNGQGVVQDFKEAVKWYRLASDQGVPQAQFSLGVMYANGKGVAQDYKEAMKWYCLAADQGIAAAQSNLGLLYKRGLGVPKDFKEAVKWFRIAAAQGNTSALKELDEYCIEMARLAGPEPPKQPIFRIETGMHTQGITQISVDAENRLLATVSTDKTIRIWDAQTGDPIRVIRPPVGEVFEGELWAVALSPDGKTVVVGGNTSFNHGTGILTADGNTIYVFDTKTGGLLKRLHGLPSTSIYKLVFSHDGQYLAACLSEGGIRIYQTNNFTLAVEDKDYGEGCFGAAFDHESGLVTTSYDGYIRRYDARFRLASKVKALGGSKPREIAISPDERFIAVGFSDTPTVNVLSVRDLTFLFTPDTKGINGRFLTSVAWSSDGRCLYAGGNNRIDGKTTIRIWSDKGRGSYVDVPVVENFINDLQPRKEGGVFFGANDPAFGAVDGQGKSLYTRNREIWDYRSLMRKQFEVSHDGTVIHYVSVEEGAKRKIENILSLTDNPNTTIPLDSPRTEALDLSITDWKNTSSPKLNGIPLKIYSETSQSYAIAHDGKTFLLGTNCYIHLFSAKGKEIWRVEAPDTAWGVNITGDGRYALAALGDGTIRWYTMSDGREILTFFPHIDQKRWVLWTPEGFFNASEGGAQLIGYHLNQGKDSAAKFIEGDKLFDQFFRPDLVMAKFQGKDISEYAKSVDINRLLAKATLPPTVRLTTMAGTREKRDTVVEGEICDQGGGIGDVTLYLNGMPIVMDTGGRALKMVAKGDEPSGHISCRNFSHTVTLTEGENIISLIAKNKDNTIESSRGLVTLAFRSGQKERPDLYVLAVAVNKYHDGDLRLKYPIPDANDLVKSITAGGQRLFGKVIIKTVYDDDATRTGLEKAFKEMGNQTKRDDVFILFIAGHGITYDKDGNYYFLPVDFRYTGDEAIRKQGVSKDDLMQNLTCIQAMKSLLLFDTCNSGSFVEAVASRNIVEKTALNRLGRAIGRSTIVASSKDQAALEGYEGHGVFTWALLEGLGGKAKDSDGKITVNGLASYIEDTLPKITYKKWGYEQIPQKNLQGMDFPIALP